MVSTATSSPAREDPKPICSDIPARLDRLPWSGFHWLLVISLGITWILDGLEVTVVGSIGPMLENPDTLGLEGWEVGLVGSIYLAGAVLGALVFGYLTDRLGRKRLFTITLGIYLVGSALTAFSWNLWSFALFRFVTGSAIGGEYSAINSAIDELIPARVRGRVDLIVNGSFWIGAAFGALISLVMLNPQLMPAWLGWRLAFGIGAVVGSAMVLARQYVPESPRWLLMHGQSDEAHRIMDEIEIRAVGEEGRAKLPAVKPCITIHRIERGFAAIWHVLLVRYRRRAILGLLLIASQAYVFNGITFTSPLVLDRVFHVSAHDIPGYALLFAAGNFAGPLLLGHLFDSIGRRTMITATYALSGVMIIGIEIVFLRDGLTAKSQTLSFVAACFFASAAASAGYLTVSEIFPMEMRALAIALFYVIGTAIGGVLAPVLFGALIETGQRWAIAVGYLIGAGLMLAAAAAEWFLGVDSERKSLEEVVSPLSAEG